MKIKEGSDYMLNQLIIVGRMVREPEIKTSENGTKYTNITLAIPRCYKNEEGQYDTDFVDCVLFNGMAENTSLYCKKGDLLGVKGRIQSKNEDGKNRVEVFAEKITFLSSKVKDEKNNDEQGR